MGITVVLVQCFSQINKNIGRRNVQLSAYTGLSAECALIVILSRPFQIYRTVQNERSLLIFEP